LYSNTKPLHSPHVKKEKGWAKGGMGREVNRKEEGGWKEKKKEVMGRGGRGQGRDLVGRRMEGKVGWEEEGRGVESKVKREGK